MVGIVVVEVGNLMEGIVDVVATSIRIKVSQIKVIKVESVVRVVCTRVIEIMELVVSKMVGKKVSTLAIAFKAFKAFPLLATSQL